jgi:hypothetical protein
MSEDPYRKGAKRKIIHQQYSDGYIVWNWKLKKWDYFNEKMES